MARWVTWATVAALSLGGAVAGAAVARRLLRPRAPREDPELTSAAREVAAADPADRLTALTDRAYRRARPGCPEHLDPSDSSHAPCIRDWLALRDLVAAALPAPRIRSRHEPGLPATGPAADMRGWLESLTGGQRDELRSIIGARHYDAIAEAAAVGDDGATVAAVLRLKGEIEKLADEQPLEAMRKYGQLRGSLGDRLDELLRLAEKYKAYAG